MVSSLLSLPKLQSRSMPSRSPFSLDPRIESDPARCLFSSHNHGADRCIGFGPWSGLKRSRMINGSGDTAGRENDIPREKYRERLPESVRKRRWRRRSGTRIPRMELWHVASSIRHVLRKAKAFCNELCCDAYDDARIASSSPKEMRIDPYFSLPVVTPSTSSTLPL